MITRDQLTGPFGISIGAIAVTVIAVLWQAPALLESLVTPAAPKKDVVVEGINNALADFEKNHETFQKRYLGRYLIYPPKPPVPPRETIVTRELPDLDPIETEKPKPTVYAGPLIPSYPWGERVWFNNKARSDSDWLAIGQERDGVKLIAINAPYSVTLEWEGEQWQWDFFKSWKGSDALINDMQARIDSRPPARINGVEIGSTARPAPEVPQETGPTPDQAQETTAAENGDAPPTPDVELTPPENAANSNSNVNLRSQPGAG